MVVVVVVVGTHLVKDRGPLAVDEPARVKRERKLKVSKINSRQTRLARGQSSMPPHPHRTLLPRPSWRPIPLLRLTCLLRA